VVIRRLTIRNSTRPTCEAIRKANGFRPDFVSLGGYDGMHLVYEALKKTGGNADGDTLIAAMKGMAWESPRGPMSIDPDTRDIVAISTSAKWKRSTDSFGIPNSRLSERKGPDEGRGEIIGGGLHREIVD
jgi:ABC-type branched-subunit amino acid transport system substrate-binding protein